MKKFDWNAFTLKILVKARMEDLYNAWTLSGELERRSFYLVNLKSEHEDGLELRNKHTNIKPMVNN